MGGSGRPWLWTRGWVLCPSSFSLLLGTWVIVTSSPWGGHGWVGGGSRTLRREGAVETRVLTPSQGSCVLLHVAPGFGGTGRWFQVCHGGPRASQQVCFSLGGILELLA